MLNLAVIGDPIAHSFSPVVHGAALDALQVPHTYQKIRVAKGELPEFLDYAQKHGIDGFNLTMPHKTDILPYLDWIDPSAERFGAVNTVKVKEGKWCGYNTDADGYAAALARIGHRFRDSRVVILGAGGVVRTLAQLAVNKEAASVTILNRTQEKAEAIGRLLEQQGGCVANCGGISAEELCHACASCDLLIQATPLGMHGTGMDFADLSFLEYLPQKAVVTDLIYNPDVTKFLAKAKELSHPTLNGLGMLIYQALLADQIYLEREFDMDAVYDKVAEKIKR